MKMNLTGVLKTLHAFDDEAPLNMILDDGGDLTNMVLDRYPHLVKDIRGFPKKQQLEFIDYMKEWRRELLQCR